MGEMHVRPAVEANFLIYIHSLFISSSLCSHPAEENRGRKRDNQMTYRCIHMYLTTCVWVENTHSRIPQLASSFRLLLFIGSFPNPLPVCKTPTKPAATQTFRAETQPRQTKTRTTDTLICTCSSFPTGSDAT